MCIIFVLWWVWLYCSKQILLDFICKIFLKKQRWLWTYFRFLPFTEIIMLLNSSQMNFTFPFCLFQRKEGFEEQFFFFFFNTSKASVTHNWNFYLILWIFTENSLCSIESEGNKPINNYSYSPWGLMHHSAVTLASLNTTEVQQSPNSSTVFAWGTGMTSMHKVGTIFIFMSYRFMKEILWGQKMGDMRSQILFYFFYAFLNIPD